MGFWTLFEAASMPILELLLISVLGAFMATEYCNLLSADARKSLNKIVFMVFTPSLIFASLARTVTFQDIISWWFMPVNIAITFLLGGILGWVVVKLLKPKPYLDGLVIAMCASGNMGNLMLIIVPAMCYEDNGPFGDKSTCSSIGLSYASFSMALGGLFIWTYTFNLVQASSVIYKELYTADDVTKHPNKDLESNESTHLLKGEDQERAEISVQSTEFVEDVEDHPIISEEPSNKSHKESATLWGKLVGVLHTILEELLAPPTFAAALGFIFGAIPWLKKLIVGNNAPLRVILDSIKLLGDGTIPCITLILGGNLAQGLRSSRIRPIVILGVISVRYMILPAIGIWVVKAADHLGFLPPDPLYHYVLMIQFTLPPATNIGTMTQLFNVGQKECSVLFLWTYLIAALALTFWSTVYMWILS